MARADDRPPSTVADLMATVIDPTTIRLTWTAPSDDSPMGGAMRYDLRGAARPISDSDFFACDSLPGLAPPRGGGSRETTLVNVHAGQTWYARLRAVDGSGNWSGLSNSVSVTLPAVRFDLVVRNPARAPVQLQWWTSSVPHDAITTVRIHDLAGRLVWRGTVPSWSSGTTSWNGKDLDGRALASGVYFANLVAPGASVQRKFVLLSP
jgi:hypothetical protein